jgi:hypothetical protein
MSDSPMRMSFKVYDSDLADKQFHAVYLVGDKIIDFSTSATVLSIGIMDSKPPAVANEACSVVMVGPCKAKLGGTVAEGQFLVPNSEGQLVAVTLGTTTTNVAVARALEDGADHDVKEVFVLPQFIQV